MDSPELAARAAHAWEQMVRERTVEDVFAKRHPMLPAIAIDYVQEANGERDDAVMALMRAAADWLTAKQPAPANPPDEFDTTARDLAAHVCEHVRLESAMAEVHLALINEGIWRLDTGHALILDAWRLWVRDARRVIALCRQLFLAAYPA